MKVAIIDKAPGRTDYRKYFDFIDFDLFHMSSVPITKLLKKDVDLVVNLEDYDYVICVGSEAAKEYAKVTSVTNFAGSLVNKKFIPITNPAMLSFKPEGKPDFERAVLKIKEILEGKHVDASNLGDFKGINNSEEALAFLQEVLDSNAEAVAWDTETTALYPRDGYVLGLSLSYKEMHGRYIITDILDNRHTEMIQAIADKYFVVYHNMKFDWKMIEYHLGTKFDLSRCHDTMLMHYVLDENDSHSLKALALKYTKYGNYDAELDLFKKEYCRRTGIKEEDFTYDLIPYDIISKYAAIDTAVTLELYNKFKPLIRANPRFTFVYEQLLRRGTDFLRKIEEVGIPISKERLMTADVFLSAQIAEARATLYAFPEVKRFEEVTGKIFNPGSVPQLRQLLFDYVGLTPTGKLTKAGAVSTDKEVLAELSSEHPIPEAILKLRALTKIQSSYVVKILPALDRDGRIRTNFNIVFTTSGRLSSSGKFNAQQIPRDDPIIKGCIVAPPGYSIVSQDLSTAEVYYAAFLSGDKNLQSVFKGGGDLHSTIAKMVFNLPCAVEDVKKLHGGLRQAAKAITFGILYGSGPAKVAESVTKAGEYCSIDDAKGYIADYFAKFSRLKKWLDERKDFIKANAFTYSFFGRKRRLPNVRSADKGIAAHDVRSGINAEVQSLASDMNLLGAMDTWDECESLGLDAKIFMLVHDSIVALVKDEHVEQYCKILKLNTQKDRGCSIPGFPVGVDQDIGKDYSFGDYEERYITSGATVSDIQSWDDNADS